jgi:N-acetylglutamate synthase
MNSPTNTPQFRLFTIADYDAVIAFWKQQEGVGLSDADERENVAAYLDRNPNMSFTARQGYAIIGAVLCGHDGRRGYLHHLAVAPAHRKKGIGKELVRLALEQLARAGIHKCNIFLFDKNGEGEAFWHATGFADRSDLKIMQRTIGGSREC